MTTSIIKRNNGNSQLPSRTPGNWMDQVLNENLTRFFNDDFWGFSGIEHQVTVPVNLRETDNSYEMSLVAPGLRKEDFKLNVIDDLLTVSYEQKQNDESKNDGWLTKEFRMQSFTRSFNLGKTIDVNKITASYDNGILHLTLPKKDEARKLTKQIEVK